MIKLIIHVLNKLHLLGRINMVVKTTVNNRAFRIPLQKKLGFENIHISELWMIQLLEKILSYKEGGVYIDVGVNLGQTLIKLKSVRPDIKYYGFEPNPSCVFYVNELIKINGFKEVTIFPVGISDRTEIHELLFFNEDESDSSATIIKDFRPDQKIYQKEYVPCFKVSDVIEKYAIPRIGVLKIDVEGAEKEVIEGFKDRIIEDQPVIQLEILPVYNEMHKDRLSRQEYLEHFFEQINYTMFRIYKDSSDRLAGLKKIHTIGIHSNMDWCEYLVVPFSISKSIEEAF